MRKNGYTKTRIADFPRRNSHISGEGGIRLHSQFFGGKCYYEETIAISPRGGREGMGSYITVLPRSHQQYEHGGVMHYRLGCWHSGPSVEDAEQHADTGFVSVSTVTGHFGPKPSRPLDT